MWINWVAWYTISKSKTERGLEVKNYEVFNDALLSKWAWKILTEDDLIWYKVLSFKFDDPIYSMNNSKSYIWWGDIRI